MESEFVLDPGNFQFYFHLYLWGVANLPRAFLLLFFFPMDDLSLGRIYENFLNDFLLNGSLNTDLSLSRVDENFLDNFLLNGSLSDLLNWGDLLDGSLNDFLLNNGSLNGDLRFDSLGFGRQILCLHTEFFGGRLLSVGAELSCLSTDFFSLSTEGF